MSPTVKSHASASNAVPCWEQFRPKH
jgi:hypothetical protein